MFFLLAVFIGDTFATVDSVFRQIIQSNLNTISEKAD